MTKSAAIYARVSTANGQTPENQLQELRSAAKRMGWEIVEEFVDEGISGAKGRDKRPEFDRMCRAAVRREFDVVMAWSVDRLGRSLQDLIAFLGDIHAKGVDLYLHQQGVDTTTPGGKALFQMLGVFAEFERAIIRERITAGLTRARAEGRQLGRPPVTGHRREEVLRLRSEGRSVRAIAESVGMAAGTVHKILKAESA